MTEPSKVITKYPRKWKNTTSGAELRVMPWWETIKDGEVEEVDELGLMFTEEAGRLCKFGVLVQVGFLIENDHGVWFGVGPQAAEAFEDLGHCPATPKDPQEGGASD